MSSLATSSIVPFDSGKSYVVRGLCDNERLKHRFVDQLGRTEKDRCFLEQFELIFSAACRGDLLTCQRVVEAGFRDLHAFSVNKYITQDKKGLDKVTPIKIAEINDNKDVTEYFQSVLTASYKAVVLSESAPKILPSHFPVLQQTSASIFYAKPISVGFDNRVEVKDINSITVKGLIEKLKEKGPFVAFGNNGPDSYEEMPFKLNDCVSSYSIYGWKPGSKRMVHSKEQSILVLGAKKCAEKGYVYFTLSKDLCAGDENSSIRNHMPSNNDSKVYIISGKTFIKHLGKLYDPIIYQSKGEKSSS